MLPEASAPGGHEIELVGELAGILALSEADMSKRFLASTFPSLT
ncbi:hypothetical protein [Paracoccus yeei]